MGVQTKQIFARKCAQNACTLLPFLANMRMLHKGKILRMKQKRECWISSSIDVVTGFITRPFLFTCRWLIFTVKTHLTET